MKLTRKITAFFLTAVIAAVSVCVPVEASPLDRSFDARMAQLTSLLERDDETIVQTAKLSKNYAFLSVSDGKQQAVTVYAAGNRLSTALERLLEKAKGTKMSPVWMKLDVVTSIEEVSYEDFKKGYADKVGGVLRQGISFNSYFGRALLDSQINSNGMLSYETGELDLDRINAYFVRNSKLKLEKIPEKLYLFNTQGYFTDGTGAMKLTNGRNNNKGRRDYVYDKEGLEELARMSSSYLASICGDDGKFVYGYYPIDNEEIEGYNIIRHGGTIWNLILQYDMTRDETLVPVIDRAMEFLASNLHYKDKKTAFLEENGILNVGGNGISLLAFTCYHEIMGSDKYDDVIEALANGIIFMQKKDGGFTHTLFKRDYSVYKDYIIVYYDGEAMFGILKAYGVLGNAKYLRAAEKAADYFIENNYEELNSHWISYGFNELTKYSSKPKYYSFGLLNVANGYTSSVKRTVTGAHTRGETMGAAFELYDRMKRFGVRCNIPEDFDEQLLVSAFESRISYGLNYFMFPEYAMYFPNPQIVLNSFAVREDFFRIRIDDIQHFMGGYYLYWKNYDKVAAYKNQ